MGVNIVSGDIKTAKGVLMKNKFKFMGIIAMVAVIMFGMAACDDGGGGNGSQLVGTWTKDSDQTYFFVIEPQWQNTFRFSLHEEGYNGMNGTLRDLFTVEVNGNTIEAQSMFGQSVPTITRQSNGKITIAGYTTEAFNGTYTKQPE